LRISKHRPHQRGASLPRVNSEEIKYENRQSRGSVSHTITTETIIVNARNASTGASVNGTVTLNGYQTFQTGQSFTFTTAVKTCDPELKPPCHYERVFNDFTVTAPGYNPVTFIR
jgi:hypothetical protein